MPAWVLHSLLVGLSVQFLVGAAFAKPLYSYRDDQGINVITDNYANIPMKYHGKVVTIDQEADRTNYASGKLHGVAGFLKEVDHAVGATTISMPGMTPYQSHALTVVGALALLCFALRQFSRSQVFRFLATWGLIMLAIVIPAVVFLSQDGPLDKLRGQASAIQNKQLNHLKQAQ